MPLQVKVDSARGHDARPWFGSTERQRKTRHRDRMRIVGVHDLRFPLTDDAG